MTIQLPRQGTVSGTATRAALAALPTAECVVWSGRIEATGYGGVSSPVTSVAHRLIYLIVVGPPELPELDHLCRNTRCVNPAHLEPVTTGENARRRVAATPRCRNGHLYGPDNTYLYRGRRFCRDCRRAYDRTRPSGGARARKASA